MGFLSGLFGGGGGTTQTTYVSTSTKIDFQPQIANVVEVPLEKLIDAITKQTASSDQVHVLSAVASLQAAEAQAQSGANTAAAIQGFGKNILLAGAAIAAVMVLQKWG